VWKKFKAFGGYYRKMASFTNGRNLSFFMYSKHGECIQLTGWRALLVNVAAMTGIPSFVRIFLARFIKAIALLRLLRTRFEWRSHHTGHLASAHTSDFETAVSGRRGQWTGNTRW
jgi:hypothetical protein